MEAWRRMESADRIDFINWAINNLNGRWDKGDDKYDSGQTGFKGDPIDHAIEEALDLLVYLWVAKSEKLYREEKI